MPTLKWEHIYTGFGDWMQRAKVPGGWLISHQYEIKQGYKHEGKEPMKGQTLTFYPDPDHKWDGGSL